MKTKQEIRKYAEGLAQDHFYSGDDTPWEPFEDYPQEWLEVHFEALADAIEEAMLWAQGDRR
jgi:hypothetical protein